MKKKICVFLFFIFCTLTFALNFSVFPTDFKVDATRTTTQEASVINNTTEPLRVEIYAESDPEYGKDYNLNPNIKVFPKTVSIKPGGTQKVRFRVKSDSRIRDGVNKSYLTFKEMPYEIKNASKDKNSTDIKTQLNMITVLSIPVYSLGENIIATADIKNVKLVDKKGIFNLSLDVISKGNAPIYLIYELNVIGSDFTSKGGIGNTARDGAKKLNVSFEGENGLQGKKANLKITDSKGKVYFNKTVTIYG